MSALLTAAESLKFDILEGGLVIDAEAMAFIDERNHGRALTPADYASTSGVILCLEGDVWVNAPIQTYNPNFVDSPPITLREDADGLYVDDRTGGVRAEFWLPPAYHDEINTSGTPYATYAFTHGDRVRISPIAGCAYTCKFCDLPYEFKYRRKDVDGLVDAVRAAIADPVQPAHHVLISGGTPRPEDYEFLRDVYQAVITSFPDLRVDVMMVPIEEVVDVAWLADLGVNELSINLEVYDDDIARKVMPMKHRVGRAHHMRFLEHAVETLGAGRVRSMLMVGLESMDTTLEGVRALSGIGCVPVLSPFRPDPITPLRDMRPPSADFMREVYLRARTIAAESGLPLGPGCRPCSHNTLSLPDHHAHGDASHSFGVPRMV